MKKLFLIKFEGTVFELEANTKSEAISMLKKKVLVKSLVGKITCESVDLSNSRVNSSCGALIPNGEINAK